MKGNDDDSLDSPPDSVFDRSEPPVLERPDSSRATISDWGGRISGVPTPGAPPVVTAPLIPPQRTEPLPPPFVEPEHSTRRTVAPGEMAAPEFPRPTSNEIVVLSMDDPVPQRWTSLMIQATDGSGRTLRVNNEEALIMNGLQQVQIQVAEGTRNVIVPIGMASEYEVAIGVRRLINSLFAKCRDGFSFVFLAPFSQFPPKSH